MTDTTPDVAPVAPDVATAGPALPAVGSTVRYAWTDPTFGEEVTGLGVVLAAVPAGQDAPAYVEVHPLTSGLRVDPADITAL